MILDHFRVFAAVTLRPASPDAANRSPVCISSWDDFLPAVFARFEGVNMYRRSGGAPEHAPGRGLPRPRGLDKLPARRKRTFNVALVLGKQTASGAHSVGARCIGGVARVQAHTREF